MKARSMLALALFAPGLAVAAAIAGLAPHQRPAGAPSMPTPPVSDTPGGTALHGVSQPIPGSLKFLRDQGNWYSPFDRSGMPGPYDIRGWYSNPPAASKH